MSITSIFIVIIIFILVAVVISLNLAYNEIDSLRRTLESMQDNKSNVLGTISDRLTKVQARTIKQQDQINKLKRKANDRR